MVKVRLNGEEIEVEKGTKIASLVDKHVFAALVNGMLSDLSAEISGDSEVELIDFSTEQGKKIYWHSASHVMAMAVKALYPDAKLAIGPAIDQGFYYDFDTKEPFSPEIQAKIEKRMAKIIKQDMPFERMVMKKSDAIGLFKERNEA